MATKEQLLSAGFTEEEILKEAGFSDAEIKGKVSSTLPPQQLGFPMREWTGIKKNAMDFYNMPSILKTLGGMVEGGIETGVRALQPSGLQYPASPKGQAFQQGIIDPLAKQSVAIQQDPLGFLTSLPGKTVDYARDNPLDMAMNLVPFLPKGVQSWVNPITLASKPVGKVIGRYFSNPEAQRLYTSSVNIVNRKSSLEDIHRTAQRGLDLGLLPNEKHLAELKLNMGKVGKQIDDVIQEGARSGGTVDAWKITDYVDNVKSKFQSKALHDPELDKVLENMKEAFVLEHGEKIPVNKAQEIKRTTQQFLDKQFDRLTAIKVEAEKALEHGIRIELENKYPKLKTLNPTQQENVWLKEAITSSIKQEMRSKVLPGISLFNAIKNRTIDNPMVKARVAIIMDRMNKGINMVAPSVPTATAVPFIANQFTDPYQQMAEELMGGK